MSAHSHQPIWEKSEHLLYYLGKFLFNETCSNQVILGAEKRFVNIFADSGRRGACKVNILIELHFLSTNIVLYEE